MKINCTRKSPCQTVMNSSTARGARWFPSHKSNMCHVNHEYGNAGHEVKEFAKFLYVWYLKPRRGSPWSRRPKVTGKRKLSVVSILQKEFTSLAQPDVSVHSSVPTHQVTHSLSSCSSVQAWAHRTLMIKEVSVWLLELLQVICNCCRKAVNDKEPLSRTPMRR